MIKRHFERLSKEQAQGMDEKGLISPAKSNMKVEKGQRQNR